MRLGIVRSSAEDFLIVANLINQNPKLADTVDLRADIKSLPLKRPVPSSADQGNLSQVSIKEAKGILKQNLVTILETDAKIEHSDNMESWTTDGNKIYAIKEGILKYNMPKSRNESVFLEDSNKEMDNPPANGARICWF
jgi:hypothetical protein